jgi:hypothetical protein
MIAFDIFKHRAVGVSFVSVFGCRHSERASGRLDVCTQKESGSPFRLPLEA